MKPETYLHPDTFNRNFLLAKLFSFAGERITITDDSSTSEEVRSHGFGEIVEYILSEVKKLHNLTIGVSGDEKYKLINYLDSSQGTITYQFLDEVYQVYNEALKREIVDASKLPLIASLLWDLNAMVINAKDKVLDEYS